MTMYGAPAPLPPLPRPSSIRTNQSSMDDNQSVNRSNGQRSARMLRPFRSFDESPSPSTPQTMSTSQSFQSYHQSNHQTKYPSYQSHTDLFVDMAADQLSNFSMDSGKVEPQSSSWLNLDRNEMQAARIYQSMQHQSPPSQSAPQSAVPSYDRTRSNSQCSMHD